MSVLCIADNQQKLSTLRSLLAPTFDVDLALLGERGNDPGKPEAVIVAVDIRRVDTIAALKQVISRLGAVPKRIFLIDEKTHLFVVQAHALGATSVLRYPVTRQELFAELVNQVILSASSSEAQADSKRAAVTGAASISSIFAAVQSGKPVDVAGVARAAGTIADSVMNDGLTNWLATVRRHHEGTYQHCLLVAGIAVDFGHDLGVGSTDIQRLAVAAMFHDTGKACIPREVLDKRGRLDPEERAVIETHSAAGYDALLGVAGISAEVLDAVRHHHEYLDGSGYPDRLSGSEISDIVRILTISDIFAALIEDRRYKPAMPREQAYEIIRTMIGKLEAPLVAAFRNVALGR